MISTLAIIFNTKPILEKDILVELFSYEEGRIRAFAKYSQSKKPRFGGQLNTLNACKIMMIKRGDSYNISQISVVNGFEGIKVSYEKMSIAYQLLHLIKAVTQMNHENNELFMFLYDHLKTLNGLAGNNLAAFKLDAYKKLLQLEGVLDINSKLSEHEVIKMIESYTSIKLRDVL